MKLNSSEEGAFLFCLFLVDSVFFENSFDTLTDRFLLRKRDQSSARNGLDRCDVKTAFTLAISSMTPKGFVR